MQLADEQHSALILQRVQRGKSARSMVSARPHEVAATVASAVPAEASPAVVLLTAEALQALIGTTTTELGSLEAELSAFEEDAALDKQLSRPLEGLSPADVLAAWDINRDGQVQKAEFRRAIRQMSHRATNDDISELFDRFDRDAGGTLDRTELRAAMKELHEGILSAQAQGASLRRQVEYRTRRIVALEACIASTKLAEAAERALAEGRDEPPLNVRLGRFVASRPLGDGKGTRGELASKWQETMVAVASAEAGPKSEAPPEEVGPAATGLGAGRMTKAGFVKQCIKHKNIGDVRIEGGDADVSARLEALFDSLCTMEASTADVSDANVPTLSIDHALEALTEAARRHEEGPLRALTEESAVASTAAADAQRALATIDEAELAAAAATKEEAWQRQEEAVKAQELRRARQAKDKEDKAAAEAAAEAEKERRRAEEREKVQHGLEQQMLRTAMSKGEVYETREMVRKKGVRVWRGLADEKITEMASNLDAVLQNDGQLKVVFESIDLDRGGSIDRREVELALVAAGRQCSREQLDAMMRIADADDNGDVDLAEFRVVLQAVKAANAALAVQQAFRSRLRKQALEGDAGRLFKKADAPAAKTEAKVETKLGNEKQAERESRAVRKVQAVARGKAARKKAKAKKEKKG